MRRHMYQLALSPRLAAAFRRRLLPLRISIMSLSASASLLNPSIAILFPRPPRAWFCPAPAPLGLRLPPPPPPPPPFPPAPLVPAPFVVVVEVSGRGNGEGISSTDSECGFGNGPDVIGRLLMSALFAGGPGVGGGDVPNLLRSFRVSGGREWASRVASENEVRQCQPSTLVRAS
jgi:hypothetical protein